MIPKSTQVRKLITVTALNLLLTTAIASSWDGNSLVESEVKAFAEYDIRPARDYEAGVRYDPNIMNDGYIAVAYHVYNSSLTEARDGEAIGSWIKIIGPESEPNRIRSECFVPFKRATTSSVKRLSDQTVLYAAHAHGGEDGQGRMRLILVNTHNCKYVQAYNGSLPSENHFIYPSSNASDESFTLVVQDNKFCRGHNWCRLSFNPLYHKFEPLHLDFSSHELLKIEPARSFDAHLFAVHLIDRVTNTYHIRLYNISNNAASSNYKQLLSLANYMFGAFESLERYQVISSSLSFCWRTKQDTNDDKIIHCAAFREDGSVAFNKTIVYADIEEFLQLRSIPNGLILIGATSDCVRRNCSIVEVAVIRSNFECIDSDTGCTDLHSNSSPSANQLTEIEHRQYNFVCGSLLFTSVYYRVNVSAESIEIDHMCIGFGSSFLHNLFNIGQAMLLRDNKSLN